VATAVEFRRDGGDASDAVEFRQRDEGEGDVREIDGTVGVCEEGE